MKVLNEGLKDINISPTNPDENWKNMKNLLQTTAIETLGPVKRRHHDWFDENDPEIQSLLDEKHKLHLVYLNEKSQANKDRYNNARRSLENRLNEMRNT